MKLDAGGKTRAADGRRCLRVSLSGSARGGLIQRIVVEPGKKYELSVAIRTEGLAGEAYVTFFAGDINDDQAGKTAPVRSANSKWTAYTAKWFPGTTRVVYVACYVKGTSGQVSFDAVTLREVR